MKYLPGLASNHDPPNLWVVRIIGVSHHRPATFYYLRNIFHNTVAAMIVISLMDLGKVNWTPSGKNSLILYAIKNICAGRWWFTPVILATQVAEIRRIEVWSQPQTNSSWDPTLKKLITKKGPAGVFAPIYCMRAGNISLSFSTPSPLSILYPVILR
jgi:hypothetical protein